MSRKAQLPEKLLPYLQLPPEASLILLTSTLGCSSTWLTTRFVGAALSSPLNDGSEGIGVDAGGAENGGSGNAVVLVSWLREEAFWKGEARRSMVS